MITPRAFDRKTIGIVRAGKAADVDAGHALQRLGHRTVWQCADIFGGDDVDERVGVALDILRAFETGAEAADDDFVGIVDDFRLFDRVGRVLLFASCANAGAGESNAQGEPDTSG